MDQFSAVRTFVDRAKSVRQLADLGAILKGTVESLGFKFHALGHHVDLQLPPENAVRIVNYPTGWFERVLQRRYFVEDPVLLLAQRSAAGFRWADIPRLMKLTSKQRAILNQAPREGLGAGYTVPIHVPGEYSGSISFAVRPGEELPESAIPSTHYVGTVAFEAARRLQMLAATHKPSAKSSLSPRQRDCVALAAQGLSDKDIAAKLGIQPYTAHGYIEEAMAHYGARRRTQMVVRALFEGDIAYSDALK